MEVAEQAAATDADTEQAARTGAEGNTQQAHVADASGGMTCARKSKIPMRYLAAAAADRRLPVEEAATAAAAAVAAASAATDRRSVDKAVAAAAAFNAALQDVVVTQAGNADLGQQIRQAAEQDWSLSNALSDQVTKPAVLPLPGSSSTLPVSQLPVDKLNEPEGNYHSLGKAVLDHAQRGCGDRHRKK